MLSQGSLKPGLKTIVLAPCNGDISGVVFRDTDIFLGPEDPLEEEMATHSILLP